MSVLSGVPRFVVSEPFAPHANVTLGEDAARHMRVLRLGPGSAVLLLDGQGARARGTLRTLAKRNATVEVEAVDTVPMLPAVHALVPVADRDRMLWLAEKCAELGLTSWRPVLWKRSRSVSPRGEGMGFQAKVVARMTAALEQSGNAWLPAMYPDATVENAISALPEGRRLVLDAGGARVADVMRGASPPVTIAIGPEGGFDESEIEALHAASFESVSLAPTILRFETAGITALAHARAALTTLETAQ